MTTGFFTADREPALSLEIRGPDEPVGGGAAHFENSRPQSSVVISLTRRVLTP